MLDSLLVLFSAESFFSGCEWRASVSEVQLENDSSYDHRINSFFTWKIFDRRIVDQNCLASNEVLNSFEIRQPRRGVTYNAQRIIINSKIKHICICSACSFHYYFCSFRKHRRWITSVMWFVIASQPWQWRIRTKCDVRRNREIKQFPFVRRRGRRLRSIWDRQWVRDWCERLSNHRESPHDHLQYLLLNQHLVLLWVEYFFQKFDDTKPIQLIGVCAILLYSVICRNNKKKARPSVRRNEMMMTV